MLRRRLLGIAGIIVLVCYTLIAIQLPEGRGWLAVSRGVEYVRMPDDLLWNLEQHGRPRAVIYYLTQSSRLGNLSASLASLDANFNNEFQYPVVIFYESSDTAFREDRVRNSTKSLVFFQQVTFQLPPFINTSLLPTRGCAGKRPIGYRHMCRFHAYSVHREPILSGVDYALRLDDDSRLMSPVTDDIFEFVRSNDIKYGYTAEASEVWDCAVGLHEAVKMYVNKMSLKPTFFHQWQRHRMFYNNFELSSLALWRSKEYTDFIEYIDKLGGIYYHRWGDAPIRTFAVSLFVERNETYIFQNISYRHLSFGSGDQVPGWSQ